MTHLLSAGAAFLGLVASSSTVGATPFDFTYTGGLVTFTVPTTDTYQILAFGAQGGGSSTAAGGLGAEIGGDFTLTAGEVLQIAVGGVGGNGVGGGGIGGGSGGGGGGGSFVVGPGTAPLIIAGGGGGGAVLDGIPFSGEGGLTSQNGGPTTAPDIFGNPTGGIGGNGGGGGAGFSAAGGGGGGGGFFSAGLPGLVSGNEGPPFFPTGGSAGGFPDLIGGVGAVDGGFGGGGAAEVGAGGGGGYSGGAGGGAGHFGGSPGGGGGSFDAGLDQILMADFQSGNGEVVITEVVTPEPASFALLGSALIGLAVVWRRRQSKA